MLVLSRKVNEEITIGDDVLLKVISIKGAAVRIGIEAPTTTRVTRGEATPLQIDGETDGEQ